MHCVTEPFTIGRFLVERNVIDEKPPYQRESAIWSLEKQQLFIDSIFNGYDVPKIYLHDRRGDDARYKYAIIDGKQRLYTVWEFLDGSFTLADDFTLSEPEPKVRQAAAGDRFNALDAHWQEIFKSRQIDVVLVQNANEDDIEELFSRLNNGEPLNAAEKRNAIGGDMTVLIRDIAKHDFFARKLRVANTRYQHYEIAAKLLLLEKQEAEGGGVIADLKKRFLDNMVRNNRSMPSAAKDGLRSRVERQLKVVGKVFHDRDPLLSKQAYPPMYYVFVKVLNRDYAHATLYKKIHDFLERFHVQREENLQLPEDERDPVLIEFGRLVQQGTNDRVSIETRVSILRRYFVQANPDIAIRDRTRAFTEEERLAIWIAGGKQCDLCGKALPELEDMAADHEVQWAYGGPTTLDNARALCGDCNAKEAKRVL